MNNVMCDLECLDSASTAAIISIGLVYFDLQRRELGDELYLQLSIPALKQQLSLGRTMSLDTMCWWMQQSDEARAVWKGSDNKIGNGECLSELKNFFDIEEKVILWGNGSTYDNVVLRGYLQTFNAQVPFHYSRDYCYRTMKGVFGHKAKLERVGTHHNALDDAKTQAMHLINMYKAVTKCLD
jgi:hypothetical protein